MAYTRFFDPKLHFAYTLCTGIIDDHQLLIYIMSFHTETKDDEFIRELVDVRPLHNLDKLTARGLVSISDKHKKLFAGKDFKRAVLNRPGDFNRVSGIYASLVSDGFQMRSFDGNIEEPLAWLGYGQKEIGKLKRFIDDHSKDRFV